MNPTNERSLKMVYVAHPFDGKPENVAKVEQIIMKLLHKYPDMTPYSPLHATGFFYHEFDYDTGMQHCYEALRRCEELWICEGWQNSKGCNLELQYALMHGIPVKFLTSEGDIWT